MRVCLKALRKGGKEMGRKQRIKTALLTRRLKQKLLPLGATTGMPIEKIRIPTKFFDSVTRRAFFPVEYDFRQNICYGLVVGARNKCVLAYFSVSELESLGSVKRHMRFYESTLAQVYQDMLWMKKMVQCIGD